MCGAGGGSAGGQGPLLLKARHMYELAHVVKLG